MANCHNVKPCPRCWGGAIPIPRCPRCNGFGYVTKDGRPLTAPVRLTVRRGEDESEESEARDAAVV